MLLKCSLVLLLAGFIGGAEYYSDPFASPWVTTSCPHPTIEHGRARVKQRTRLVKFMCAPRYELVGNRYATCRSGQWDVPMPVCVKPSCAPFKPSLNAIQVKEHHEAWVVTFCLPGYKLKGSSVVYCNGYKWNDTAPVCVDTSEKAAMSCDFEDRSICGWTQDELHDFDWRRWNLKTPSSMLATGPSHDHTPGTHGQGYYMYIESTSEIKNSTARLLSPVYDSSLTADGCFSFFYHMFGRDIGGLRVYQKPDSIQLFDLLNVTSNDSNDSKYILFQMWGNQGNEWYNNVLKLIPMDEDFQIVIEGIRGATFISDIAIDDVSLLQGNECTAAQLAASTPPPPAPADQLQTCKGRCDQDYRNPNSSVRLCGCSISCLINRNCCPDFLDLCLDGEESDPVPSSTEILPETQKLVGETTTAKPTTVSTPTSTANQTTSTTAKPTTSTKSTITSKPTITTRLTTTAKPTTTSKPTTISKPTTTAKPISPKPNSIPKPTTSKPISTLKPTIPTKSTTTAKPIVKFTTTIKPRVNTTTAPMLVDDSEIERKKQETEVNLNKMEIRVLNTQEKSSTWKTAVITITVLALSVALIFLAVTARSARGRVAIARLRGRSNHDSEVRYLNTADDDDL